jgi:hypothetical protein
MDFRPGEYEDYVEETIVYEGTVRREGKSIRYIELDES